MSMKLYLNAAKTLYLAYSSCWIISNVTETNRRVCNLHTTKCQQSGDELRRQSFIHRDATSQLVCVGKNISVSMKKVSFQLSTKRGHIIYPK